MARKSSAPSFEVNGNAPKYLCYREAWARVKLARENGYPFEAIAILESIMVDRLLCFLSAAGEPEPKGHPSLGKLIKAWQIRHIEPPMQGRYSDLRTAIDAWRMARNSAVHGIVRTLPDARLERIDDFLAAAEAAADDGAALARALTNWCRRTVREWQDSTAAALDSKECNS